MILQGVRHPISCLGVCDANDPPKEGCMASAPTLDVTTSLQGDFLFWLLMESKDVTGGGVQSARLPTWQLARLPTWQRAHSTQSAAHGHEATDTGLAYPPVSQAHGHHHIVQCFCSTRGGGGVGTRPWWLALLACGGAYWPLAFEPSATTSRHPYYCGHPHCRGHPRSWVGIQNATSAHGGLISAQCAVITKTPGWEVLTTTAT